jgi:hypothetical protein
MKKEKRIPTILGLILILGTVFISSRLVSQTTTSFTQASGECDPINPQITNLTHQTATISFTTSSACLVDINVANQTISDPKGKGTIHYLDITGLEASKAYIFSIISGGKEFKSDSYNFKTAQKPNQDIPTSNLAWGRVLNPDQSPATDAIVYLNIPGASALSASVTSSGNWNIALATSFNESLNDWFTPPSDVEENITVITTDYPATQIINTTSHNNPVPDIILGQDRFSAPESLPTNQMEDIVLPEYTLDSSIPLDITNPTNNEQISTQKPDFFGTGQPNSTLKIKIESPIIISGQTTVNADGSWNWSPPQNLTPGEHTITVTDSNNKSVTRKFIVLAAEAQTSFSASPSATIITPTPTPTIVSKPTAIPTHLPTPTPIPVVKPSTSSGIPKTGILLPNFVLVSLAVISIIFAVVYYKKS